MTASSKLKTSEAYNDINPICQESIFSRNLPESSCFSVMVSTRKFVCSFSFFCHKTRGGSKGGRGGRAPSPQKFQPCFFAAWHACSARLTFDQRTVYVLSTARVSRSVSSQVHAVCVTVGRSI